MKITIDKGENINNALNLLNNFLLENYSDYSILKNSFNVYVTLKNDNEEICPDNEKEYIISIDCIRDVLKERKELALNNLLSFWSKFVVKNKKILKEIERFINLDEIYINSAIKKNRKKENIDKRKLKYEENKIALNKQRKLLLLIDKLDIIISNNDFKINFVKNTYNSLYQYEIYAMIIFENVDGENYWFNFKGLHNGLPENFYIDK